MTSNLTDTQYKTVDTNKIRVLIADDSLTTCQILKSLLEAQPNITIIGIAHNGADAVRLAKELKPDVITLDVYMPVLDGLEATRQIMLNSPCPIIMISSFVDDEHLRTTFKAFDYGALACITKPPSPESHDFNTISREIISTVRALTSSTTFKRPYTGNKKVFRYSLPTNLFNLIVIGSSTGGPQALKSILSHLPDTFSLPVLIVQHISKGFIEGMISWLQTSSNLPIKLAEDGMPILPGHVYFAPDNAHLCVNQKHNQLVMTLNTEPPINGFRPSVTALFESVALSCASNTIGLILTGMGADGATGLLSMRQAGAYTLAQDEASSIVYGMPKEALKLDAVDEVVNLPELPSYLLKLDNKNG